jgi:hypothetical protein
MWVFLCSNIYPQAALAFLAGSSVVGHGTQRVRDLRAVFMTLSEDQLKKLKAFTNNLYHAHCSSQNLPPQRAQRLLFYLG